MRILLYTDVHVSSSSSLLHSRGTKYSKRLENIIKSLDWAEALASEKQCNMVVCLGDFFDKPSLDCETITAMKEIHWANLPHKLILGNHETSSKDLEYSSAYLLHSFFDIISNVTKIECSDDLDIICLPYITEDSRLDFNKYTSISNKNKKVVFSHNDINGIRYGAFVSKEGFNVKDIEENCELFLNGHLHNQGFVGASNKILNLGNLTGQNFSEDAFKYKHGAWILDTDTLKITFYENPFALNYYKININNLSDLEKIEQVKNAIITVQCKEQFIDAAKKLIENSNQILASRITKVQASKQNINENVNNKSTINEHDYLQDFKTFYEQEIDSGTLAQNELDIIIGAKEAQV